MKHAFGNRWQPFVVVATVTLALAAQASAQTFRHYKKWFSVGAEPSAIAAADLNEDGLPEIVTADMGKLTDPRNQRPANNEMSLLVPTAPLEYLRQGSSLPKTGFGPCCVALANIDALPAKDILVGSFHVVPHWTEARHLTLLRNLKEFQPSYFSVPTEGLSYTKKLDADDAPVFTKPGITSLTVSDFDHDGYRDVIATGWSSDVLIYFPGHPESYFEAPRLIAAQGGPRDVQAADLDKDGELDLVTTMYSTGEVAIWRGDGKGRFVEADRLMSRGNLPHKVRLSDINGDGICDIAVSHCHTSDSVVIFYGEGKFGFSLSQEMVLGESRPVLEHEIRDLLVEDLNGDGRADMAVACHTSGQVIVLVNVSEDKGAPQKFRKETYGFKEIPNDPRPRALCSADFDNDGRKDIGVALWGANAVTLLLGKGK